MEAPPSSPWPQSQAKMTNGSYFSYFDTGTPSPDKTYKTYLLLPGVGHNKWIWLNFAQKMPESVRLIAFTCRGYDGSSAFSDEDKSSGEMISHRLGEDFRDIVQYVVDELGVLTLPTCTLTILAWSMGNALLVSGFQTLLSRPELSSTWATNISRIIMFEPIGDLVFGQTYQPGTEYMGKTVSIPTLEPFTNFIRRISAYFEYSPAVFSTYFSLSANSNEEIAYPESNHEIKKYLFDDPTEWAKIPSSALAGFSMKSYSIYRYAGNDSSAKENEAIARNAVRVMSQLKNVIDIRAVCTRHPVPGSIMGTKWLQDFFLSNEDIGSEVRKKFKGVFWIEGWWNHYVLCTAPELLWKAVRAERDEI